MGEIFFVVYMVLGYWAVGKTIYANKILIGTTSAIFTKKMCLGFVLGWILIPVAILKAIFIH